MSDLTPRRFADFKRDASRMGAGIDTVGYIGQAIARGKFWAVVSVFCIFPVTSPRADIETLLEPQISWASYIGGGSIDAVMGVAADPKGFVYLIGHTSSDDFPTTKNASQPARQGDRDVFVAKLDPEDEELVFSTYIGGSDFDSPYGIAVDQAGWIYVTGETTSWDFPVTSNALQPVFAGGRSDAFLVVLSSSSGKLLYSSFLVGTEDDVGKGVAVGPRRDVFLAGDTSSVDFPTTANAYQSAFAGGNSDIFVAKLNVGTFQLTYSTYLGGSGHERVPAEIPPDGNFLPLAPPSEVRIAVDRDGNAHVLGNTSSLDFPLSDRALQTEYAGGSFDMFVTKLNDTGTDILYSTYFGGSGFDFAGGLALDGNGDVYVAGSTNSPDFPTANALQAEYRGDREAIVAKLNLERETLDFATYYGTNSGDSARSIAVDEAGLIYVAGLRRRILEQRIVGIGDLDGDGWSDILWRDEITGDNGVWLMNGYPVADEQVIPAVPDPDWKIAGTGDFNGDFKSDILWRHRVTGDNGIWLMNGLTFTDAQMITSVADTNWEIAGIGDFDGDGKSDILWHHEVTGQNAIWLMDGFALTNGQLITSVADTDWEIAGTGDFDGDGNADILWRNEATSDIAIWLMVGFAVADGQVISSLTDSHWNFVGTGDFDGNGTSDIAWSHDAGQYAIWQMNGLVLEESRQIPNGLDPKWRIVGLGDFDGNGRFDLLWHDRFLGEILVRPTNDSVSAADQLIGPPDESQWKPSDGRPNYDGFLSIIDPDSEQELGFFLTEGSRSDAFVAMVLHEPDRVYLAGTTTTDDLPTTDFALQPEIAGSHDGFVVGFDIVAMPPFMGPQP